MASKMIIFKLFKPSKDAGIQSIADVVLNHKAAADGLRGNSRSLRSIRWIETRSLTEPFTIQGWTKFTLMAEMAPIMTSTGIGTTSPVLATMLLVLRMESTKSKGTTRLGSWRSGRQGKTETTITSCMPSEAAHENEGSLFPTVTRHGMATV